MNENPVQEEEIEETPKKSLHSEESKVVATVNGTVIPEKMYYSRIYFRMQFLRGRRLLLLKKRKKSGRGR